MMVIKVVLYNVAAAAGESSSCDVCLVVLCCWRSHLKQSTLTHTQMQTGTLHTLHTITQSITLTNLFGSWKGKVKSSCEGCEVGEFRFNQHDEVCGVRAVQVNTQQPRPLLWRGIWKKGRKRRTEEEEEKDTDIAAAAAEAEATVAATITAGQQQQQDQHVRQYCGGRGGLSGGEHGS